MASSNPFADVAIVGTYNTKQARRLEGVTTEQLVIEAIKGAAVDAGIGLEEIDGVCGGDMLGPPSPLAIVRALGGRPSWRKTAVGIEAIIDSALAIASGQCDTVVIYAAQAGAYTDRGSTPPWTLPSSEFVEWTGLFTAAEFALIAQRHMHEYGTKTEALAEVASAIRSNGARNPEAVYFGRECAPEDVLASRMIADPYHLLDCCTASEGGAAMVLTRADRARELGVTPVYILGGAGEWQGEAYEEAPVWKKFCWSGREGGRRTFEMAGLTPADIDVCEFYDNFSWEVIRLFETYGFCGDGEGGDFVMDGRIRLDGALPTTTDGGLMSYSHAGVAQALQRVISGVHQIRGTHVNQVDKHVRHVLCNNNGSAALATWQMIISAEQAEPVSRPNHGVRRVAA